MKTTDEKYPFTVFQACFSRQLTPKEENSLIAEVQPVREIIQKRLDYVAQKIKRGNVDKLNWVPGIGNALEIIKIKIPFMAENIGRYFFMQKPEEKTYQIFLATDFKLLDGVPGLRRLNLDSRGLGFVFEKSFRAFAKQHPELSVKFTCFSTEITL